MHLTQRISSQDAQTGDPFTFDTSSSVEVGGAFLPAESHGHGTIVLARPAKGPQPGALVLDARTIDLPDGKPLAVGLEPGQLDRTLDRENLAGRGPRPTNVVYEKDTAFIVVAPPPPTPEPDDSASPRGAG